MLGPEEWLLNGCAAVAATFVAVVVDAAAAAAECCDGDGDAGYKGLKDEGDGGTSIPELFVNGVIDDEDIEEAATSFAEG